MPISIVTNEDCMDMMSRYPDKFFDLAVVDPPYGIGDFAQSDRKHNGKIKWNETVPDNNFFLKVKIVSKKQIIWGANYYNSFDDGHGAIIWDKLNMHPSMSRCEIASYSGQKKVDIFQYEWHGYIVKRLEPTAFHPCQKPVALYDWIFKNYAEPGMKILDTHLGSGSSRIAAHRAGLDFYACELDKDYFEAQEKRWKNYISQEVLF